MHPLICKIGPVSVYAYGLMLATAYLVSSFLATRKAKKSGVDPQEVFNLGFIILIFGIIGARLFYILLHFNYYTGNLKEAIMLQRGGLSWFGGLFAGSSAAALYIKKRKMNLYRTLDLVIPFVALGQAIGRIGCLLNGCCYGKVSAGGFYFASAKAVLVPVQAYACLLLLIIFLILRRAQERPHKDGTIFFLYLFLYSLKRFFIEFLRADNPTFIFGLTIFQLISLLIFILALGKLLMIRNSRI